MKLSRLDKDEKAIYDCLRSQGWSHQHCGVYFDNVGGMQEAIHHIFTLQGWSESELLVFHYRCKTELPENLPPPAEGGSHEMAIRLVEDMGRRRGIGWKLRRAWLEQLGLPVEEADYNPPIKDQPIGTLLPGPDELC